MAKNQFATILKAARDKAYEEGVWNGLRMGFDITTIALNHDFGFGADRIKRLETQVVEIINEIHESPDPYLSKENLLKSLKQIMGEDYELKGWN